MKVMVLVLTRGVAFSIQKRGRGERASLLKPDLHFVLEGLPRLQGLTNARQKKRARAKQFGAVVVGLGVSLSARVYRFCLFIACLDRARFVNRGK